MGTDNAVRTYAWIESKHRVPSDLMHQRIIDNVEKQLAAKGFQKATSNPDVQALYNAR